MHEAGTLKTNWATSAAVALAAIVSGCNSMDSAANTGHYEVRVETPMYRYGPAQSFGPDMNLKQGQHVVLMRKEYGYSRIMTDEGQTGYVATEDIIPAAAPKSTAATGVANRYPGLPAHWQGRAVLPSDGRGGRFTGPVLPTGALFSPGELPPLPENDGSGKPKETKPEFRHLKPKPGFRATAPTPVPPPESVEKPAPPPPETKAPAFR